MPAAGRVCQGEPRESQWPSACKIPEHPRITSNPSVTSSKRLPAVGNCHRHIHIQWIVPEWRNEWLSLERKKKNRCRSARLPGITSQQHRFGGTEYNLGRREIGHVRGAPWWTFLFRRRPAIDRKSTRLNSSHMSISYAVFCLKKKKKKTRYKR